MKISVIIPVLHEGEKINEILDSIKSIAADVPYEMIVVDGDLSGDTIAHISDSSVITLTTPRGRALQMNAGAANACGDILLFLHADTLLPQKAFPKIITALSNSNFIGGAFDLKIQNHRWIFRIIGRAASWKHRLTRVPYGDQAIFMLRRYFENIGGYAGIPLMEDVELMRAREAAKRAHNHPTRCRDNIFAKMGNRWCILHHHKELDYPGSLSVWYARSASYKVLL